MMNEHSNFIEEQNKQSSNFTCGSYLKHIREQKGLNLNKISEDLNVIKDILDKIENDNYQNLPPPAYLKGILKKYARYLNIDQDFILNLYFKSNGRKLTSGSFDVLPQNRFSVNRVPLIHLVIKIIGQILKYLIFLIIGVYIFIEISQFLLPARIIITYPPDNFITRQNNIEIVGTVLRTKKLYFQDHEIPLDDHNKFKEEVILSPGLNNFYFKGINALGKETVVEQKVMYYPE